jgi:hypothetical protein
MARTLAGLLAAAGAAASCLVAFAHGHSVWAAIGVAALASGFSGYLAGSPKKNLVPSCDTGQLYRFGV